MNSDSESLQYQLLSRFVTQDVTTYENPSVECEEIDGVNNPLKEAAASISGEPELGGKSQTFQLGEIPTVQERFQAVLKRRLQVQIQNHPPLFPWETQLKEYPDYVDEQPMTLVPSWVWLAQQSKLNLPITLPENIFQQLLEKCQSLLTSSLPLGAKLVQVVDSFFPYETQTLNDLAGLVLRSGTGRGHETLPMIEGGFSALQQRQQMALSLLAAKQLFETLNMRLSAEQPVAQRQWLTSAGDLKLKVECQSHHQQTKLCVVAQLPTQGVVKLQGSRTLALAESDGPGSISLELDCSPFQHTYTLSVDFPEIEQQPLLFVISLMM